MKDPPCDICRKFFEKKPEKPICGGFKCGKGKLSEPLLPENEDAFFVFTKVVNQAVFAGVDGMPVDLNYNAVKFILDLYEIENQQDCFERVLKAWHDIAEINRSKRRAEKNK
jgi:hypothetical protein